MKTCIRKLLFILLTVWMALPVPAAAESYIKGTVTGTQRLDLAYEYLDELNAYRARNGAGTLKMDRSLLDYATQRSAEVVVTCTHERPDGRGVFESTDVFQNMWGGEMVWCQYKTPDMSGKIILDAFKSSQGHDAGQKSNEFRYAGISVLELPNGNFTVAVEFGSEGKEMARDTGSRKGTWTFNVCPDLFECFIDLGDEPIRVGETPRKVIVYGKQKYRSEDTTNSFRYAIDQALVTDIKSKTTDVVNVEHGYYIPRRTGTATITATVFGKTVSVTKNMYQAKGAEPAVMERQTPTGTYELLPAIAPEKAVTIKNSSIKSGATLCIQGDSAAEVQGFTMKTHRDGTVSLISVHSDMALTVKNTTENANALTMEEYSNKTSQRWDVIQQGEYVTLVNQASGKALDVSGARTADGTTVSTYKMNGTDAQKFRLKKVSDPKHTWAGTYTVKYAANKAFVLDVAGGSGKDGANVQLYTGNGTNAQKFQFLYAGNGWYRIRNVKSGKVLDVAGGSAKPGTNVQQYAWNGTSAQLWKVVKNSDGTVTIKSKLGTVLDLSGAIAKNGRNIHAYTTNNSKAQKWALIKC